MSTVSAETWEDVTLYGGNLVYIPNRVTVKPFNMLWGQEWCLNQLKVYNGLLTLQKSLVADWALP